MKNNTSIALISCATSLLCLSTANAVETITITSPRTHIQQQWVTGSYVSIDKAQIEASGANTIAELLSSVSGTNISTSGPLGALTEIRFRGSESNHVLVTVDGVEINDNAQGGLIDLAHLTTNNIERIEILKGPQSALWGSAAVSGIINIVTKTGSQTKRSSLTAAYGNANSYQLSASTSAAFDKVHYSAGLSYLQTDGHNISRVGDEDDGYENLSFNGKVTWQINTANIIDANFRFVDYTNEFDEVSFLTGLPADADNQTEGKQYSGALRWQFSSENNIWSQILTYHVSRNRNDNLSAGLDTGSTIGKKQRLLWNHQFSITEDSIVNLAYEHVEEDFEQRGLATPYGDPNQIQDTTSDALIADINYQANNRIKLIANYRFDKNSDFDDADSYRLGTRIQLLDQVTLFASQGKAIKNPSFTERFGYFPGTFLGNPELEPEQITGSEIGLTWLNNLYSMEISLFKNKLENEILGFEYDIDSGLYTAKNGELNTQHRGLDVRFYQELADFRWQISYSYLDTQGQQSKQLRRSAHSGSFWVSYTLAPKHNVYVQADYTGSRMDVFYPPYPLPSELVALKAYWLINANYQYKYSENLSLAMKLENIADKRYENVFGFVGKPFGLMASLTFTW
ncbi:TonB-dependent receptor plug domain-containing protein [Glaciecola sp. 1036]|uniref:TonB-dependent receptor plug domain-containing protein n=1 Tax=Alteromonadaceae TaxID=72275 RepID=UPI003D008C71